ncbi:MAG: hypothetical protein VKQ33_03775 [Candidatus Sericytochromatia bacterium]|nr:hypothetical protein [Candidatus Sericytochromatia bacterium]
MNAPCSRLMALSLALWFALSPPARAGGGEVRLTSQEAEAIERALIEGKPNIATVAIASFVFPGAAQAQMGHIDHTLALWGSYLAAYTAAKALLADDMVSAGQRVSDWVVLVAFLGMAGVSAADAYGLAQRRRARIDVILNRLLARPRASGAETPAGSPPR